MHNKLDTNINRNPNYNYEIIATLLQNAKNRHISKRVTKFNKRRHKKQKWMTDDSENCNKKLNVCCLENYSSYRCKL